MARVEKPGMAGESSSGFALLRQQPVGFTAHGSPQITSRLLRAGRTAHRCRPDRRHDGRPQWRPTGHTDTITFANAISHGIAHTDANAHTEPQPEPDLLAFADAEPGGGMPDERPRAERPCARRTSPDHRPDREQPDRASTVRAEPRRPRDRGARGRRYDPVHGGL